MLACWVTPLLLLVVLAACQQPHFLLLLPPPLLVVVVLCCCRHVLERTQLASDPVGRRCCHLQPRADCCRRHCLQLTACWGRSELLHLPPLLLLPVLLVLVVVCCCCCHALLPSPTLPARLLLLLLLLLVAMVVSCAAQHTLQAVQPGPSVHQAGCGCHCHFQGLLLPDLLLLLLLLRSCWPQVAEQQCCHYPVHVAAAPPGCVFVQQYLQVCSNEQGR